MRRLLSQHGGICSSAISSVHSDRHGDTLIDGLNGTLPPLTDEQQRYYRHWNLIAAEPVTIDRAPGAGWQHANGGFALLELMIEDVTGLGFAEYMRAQMLGYRGVSSVALPISQSSFLEMFSSHGLADKVGDRQLEAGLGHLLVNANGALNVHHSGGSIGWRSIYSVFPAVGEGFCMLMNSDLANDLWIPLVADWRRHLTKGR